ncbi:TonB-dependent receptor [Sandaracinobacteroides sp. A072]|uniref:TonB-dependent receptor n=1 Tax=Sandaracinobacteroides sp. A072 TaxID=3461146 RepID=UPI004041D92F
MQKAIFQSIRPAPASAVTAHSIPSRLKRRLPFPALLALALCPAGFPAYAQFASEPRQDLPIRPGLAAEPADPVEPGLSDVLLSGALEGRGIVTPLDLAGHLPGLDGADGPGGPKLSLRGLGGGEPLGQLAPALGLFVNDVPVPLDAAMGLMLFDAKGIELLRGGQGARLGAGTTAGALRLSLAAPRDRISGQIEGGFGKYRRRLLRASVDLPMSDSIGFKLSAYADTDEGHARNLVTGERVNENDRTGIRLAGRLDATDELGWTVAVASVRERGERLPSVRCGPADPGDCGGRRVSTGLFESDLPGPDQSAFPLAGGKAAFTLGRETEATLLTSRLAWEGESLGLALVSGHVDSRSRSALDLADGRAFPDLATPIQPARGFAEGGYTWRTDRRETRDFHDLSLSGTIWVDVINWRVGGQLENVRTQLDRADLRTFDDGSATGVPVLLADRLVTMRREALAGYGLVDVRLASFVALTAGLRHTRETLTLGGAHAPGIPTRQRDGIWTPSFGFSVRPKEWLGVFYSLGRGYRPGGWAIASPTPEGVRPFAPEAGTTHQLGARGTLFDGALDYQLAGFLMNIEDAQVESAALDPLSGALLVDAFNVGRFRNRGVELDLAARPAKGLSLWASLVWQKARYRLGDSDVASQLADCRADLAAGFLPLAPAPWAAASCARGVVTADGMLARPANAPDWRFSVGGSWEHPIPPAGITLVPTVHISWRDREELSASNATIRSGVSTPAFDGTVFAANTLSGPAVTGSESGPALIVNAGIAVRTDDETWRLSLECMNCLDRTLAESAIAGVETLNMPRSWVLRARRQF